MTATIMDSDRRDHERRPTPDRALNALCDLLREVLDSLTVVELFAGEGRVSQRFLKEGAARAVCVDTHPAPDRVEADSMIWIEMDCLEFLREERVQEVGLVYSAPPYDSELNKEVLEALKTATNLEQNCLVILEEATWSHTRIEDYAAFQPIETYEFDDTKITVTQMKSAMEF